MNHLINQLVHYALSEKLIQPSDIEYAVNQVLYLLKLEQFEIETIETEVDYFSVMDSILAYALENQLIQPDETDHFEAKIIDCFIARPSEINRTFYEYYKKGPMTATNYFYQLSKATNYIKTKRIQKNIQFQYNGKYAPLDITINLSKPEKDPKLIALKKNTPSSDYPKCALCMENVGFYGNQNKADRSNHRVISLTLNHEKDAWGFQYSPYAYFNEHAIILRKEHTPMQVNHQTFAELIDFINKFPHYLIGSNAGLPIVGGSILGHYHFQGGRYDFPIEKARVLKTYKANRKVQVEVLDWPLSVIRVSSENENQLLDIVNQIFDKWQNYTNAEIGIYAHTTEPHNTITPIVKLNGAKYQFYLVLRNNITTPGRPYGVFHPRDEYFHIKKENIGLIEVMGLAVLPGRLKQELDDISACLLGKLNESQIPSLEKHLPWITRMRKESFPQEEISLYLQNQVGSIFEKVLEDCGVFKEENRTDFYRFVENAI